MYQKLTQRLAETLQPEPKRYFVRDTGVKGLSVGVNPTGRKSFYVYYRVGGGRGSTERRPVIGTFPTMTVQEARIKARDVLASAARGEDPSADRATERKAERLAEFSFQFLRDKLRTELIVETREGFRHWITANGDISAYHRNLLSIWNRHVGPRLGDLRLQDITPSRCLSLHTYISRLYPIHANRSIEFLRSMLNHAMAINALKLGDNPCSVVKKNEERRRRRYASREELVRLGQALTVFQETDYVVERSIRFLLFTGMRKMEVLKLKWVDVDLDLGIARLNTKTGQQDKKLSVLALDVLRSMPEPKSGPYVFPSKVNPQSHLVDIRKVWKKITDEAGINNLIIHDLRRTYGTYGTELNGLWASSRMLGHRSQATTEKNYAQHDNDVITQAEDTTAQHIETLMSNRSAVVSRLPQK